LKQKHWEISGKSWVLNVNSAKFPIFWLNFAKFQDKKMKKKLEITFHLHQKMLLQINIY
jgi:hypothetical protein